MSLLSVSYMCELSMFEIAMFESMSRSNEESRWATGSTGSLECVESAVEFASLGTAQDAFQSVSRSQFSSEGELIPVAPQVKPVPGATGTWIPVRSNAVRPATTGDNGLQNPWTSLGSMNSLMTKSDQQHGRDTAIPAKSTDSNFLSLQRSQVLTSARNLKFCICSR